MRLCLALMLGLLLVPGYVAAPMLFHQLADRGLAGQLAGTLFHVGNTTVLLLSLTAALFWRRLGASRPAWFLLALLLLTVAVNEFGVAARLAEIKAAAGQLAALPPQHPLRQRFGIWHGVSAALHLVSTLAAAALVAMGPGETSCKR